jgi:phosphatidylserine/phosphatidylglycerophosphate/cardiolipin synthase-like enzyme
MGVLLMFFFNKMTINSKLLTQEDFYRSFIQDLRNCKKEVIIESPYMTSSRMERLYPTLNELLNRKVKIHIVTRDPVDHDTEYMRDQATNEILCSMELGVNVILLKGYHHRKIAIIDRNVLWEGSLNILSYNNSQEIMRRIQDKESANQMFSFLKLGKFI